MIEDQNDALRRSTSSNEEFNRGHAALQRDAAIGRVSRTRGAVIVGTAGLTGVFAMLASALAPGHSLGATTRSEGSASTARVSSNGKPVMPPLANPATLGLQGPGAAPVSPASSSSQAAAPAAAVAPAPAVVSGGS
jgi:hypothetical protein